MFLNKIYAGIWIKEGFGTGTTSCKDKESNLVTETDSVLRIWKKHFPQLLVSDSSGNEDTPEPIPTVGIECIPPIPKKVKIAVSRLKKNKAAAAGRLPA